MLDVRPSYFYITFNIRHSRANICKIKELNLKNYFGFKEQLSQQKGDEKDSGLHLAARKGDNDLVKAFIEFGAEVDAQNVSYSYGDFYYNKNLNKYLKFYTILSSCGLDFSPLV